MVLKIFDRKSEYGRTYAPTAAWKRALLTKYFTDTPFSSGAEED